MKMLAGAGFVAALGLMVAPVSANLLTNGGFEDPSNTGGWAMTAGSYGYYSQSLGEGARIFAPNAVEGDRGFETSNGFGPINAIGEQVIALPFGPGNDVSFSGYINTGPGADGTTNSGTINLYDGANLVYTQTLTNTNAYTLYSHTFTPAAGSVKVEFVATGDAGWNAPAAVHFDAFSLTQVPEPASLGLVALAGLPLVLRRRRSA